MAAVDARRVVEGLRVLLDSVILIDHLNGVASATVFLKDSSDQLVISPITRAEVLAGFDENRLGIGVSLVDLFDCLAMDATIADEAARIRRQSRLKLPDAIQAAFASCLGLTLATRNTRDFSPDRFPFVVIPYRI